MIASSRTPGFAVRTRFFDEFLTAETGTRGVGQVVVVAAGLDTRAFRIDWPAGVRLFELDQPEVMAYKDAVLRRRAAAPTCARVVVEVDLREAWAPLLLSADFHPEKASA